jgi:predicted DNA-binding protein (MmcQ/YjbR family)
MDIEQIREYCINKKGVTESLPFDDTTLVFKVGNKMFALLSLDTNGNINLKCEPEEAIRLREQHFFVKPGFHMNKQHWNTIEDSPQISTKLLRQWIDDSYQLIFDKLPKKIQEEVLREKK